MNKVAAVICILACGTVLAEEKAKITPAQQIELGKKIALVDKSIEEATAKLQKAEASGDNMAIIDARESLKVRRRFKESMEANPVLHWKKLEKKNNAGGRYWKEPAEGEKEGKWVLWKEVAG